MNAEIYGQWNIYECRNCETDFAISADTDKNDLVSCPFCSSWEKAHFVNSDWIER